MPRPKSSWTSFGTLLSLVAIGGLITLGLVLASAAWASRESDLAALDRQRELVNGRLHSQIDMVADELVLMADGYANALNEVKSTSDLATFEGEKFTDIVTSIFKYDEAFVVWSDGELALHRDADTTGRYDWVKPLIVPLLQRTVDTITGGSRGGGTLEAAQTVELMRLQGRPSIAGIVPIHHGLGPSPNGLGLFLIAYRYLDGRALDALSSEQGLNGARYARSSDPQPDEVTFQIEATATKEPIGFIIWTPDLPGSKVIVGLIPALVTAALIIAGLVAGLVLLLRKSWADLQDSEQKATHRSLHDVLTDLPNRGLFAHRLADCLGERRTDQRGAVALIDLDRFKAVNDTFGHAAGDEIIRAVAGRITALLGQNDLLARLGGDEFALLLNASSRDETRELCNRIVEELSRPFSLLDGKAIAHIGCSIGITPISPTPQTVSEILHLADMALYEAKSSGRARYVEYVPTMDTTAKLREELKLDLRTFLDGAEKVQNERPGQSAVQVRDYGIEVFYQTIHRADQSDLISGAEALVRWRHAKHGLLTPDRFISLAEDSGLIHQLGKFVLEQACAAAVQWPNCVTLSVNVSPTQLRAPGFADEVFDILRQSGLPSDRLELEITETALMGGDEASVEAVLHRLRKWGIKIALDDFGTGYSSLSHLIHFGIDRIKIDRSFVRLLGTRADGAAIVSAVVALSNSLGLSTTAEGVETPGQRDFLVAAGCTDLQGFLFSQPGPRPDMDLSTGPKPSLARRAGNAVPQ